MKLQMLWMRTPGLDHTAFHPHSPEYECSGLRCILALGLLSRCERGPAVLLVA